MMDFTAFILTLLSALAVALSMLALSVLFGPKSASEIKGRPFECGMETAAKPSGTSPINFYLVAVLFLMFDVEIAFIYPWAVSFRYLSPVALWSMLIFIFILATALLYVIKKDIFSWD